MLFVRSVVVAALMMAAAVSAVRLNNAPSTHVVSSVQAQSPQAMQQAEKEAHVPSFKELSEKGPYGFVKFVDWDKLRAYRTEAARLRRHYNDLRDKMVAKHEDLKDLGPKPGWVPGLGMVSMGKDGKVVHHDEHQEKSSSSSSNGVHPLGETDLLVSKTEMPFSQTELADMIRKEVKSAIHDTLAEEVAGAISTIEVKQAELRNNPFGHKEKWHPSKLSTVMLATEESCRNFGSLETCVESGTCKWVLNDGCHKKPCGEYGDFQACAKKGTGCKWVQNVENHDEDHCANA